MIVTGKGHKRGQKVSIEMPETVQPLAIIGRPERPLGTADRTLVHESQTNAYSPYQTKCHSIPLKQHR